MTPLSTYNTLELLNTYIDASYIILHNCFRLLKPIRRKYRMSVNECLVLNGVYIYHKYKGSLFTANAIIKFIRYYDSKKISYYVTSLCDKGYIIRSNVIKGVQYYNISELGIAIMLDFGKDYQAILYKWYNDNNISL